MDQHTIELVLQVASLIAGIAVMRYQIKDLERKFEKMLNVVEAVVKTQSDERTGISLLKQTVDELRAEAKELRDAKHDHANRIQALEFRTNRRRP